MLTLSACSSDPVPPDATAKAFATAISHHDGDDLAKALQGTPEQASQIVDATRDFTPDGEPLIGGQADSSLIKCVWMRGQEEEKDNSFLAGQLLREENQERWVVLPDSFPERPTPAVSRARIHRKKSLSSRLSKPQLARTVTTSQGALDAPSAPSTSPDR